MISSNAAAATFGRFSRIEPLLSMMIPIETGTSSRLKIFSVCSTLFSKTLNDACGMLVTILPFLSTTLTYNGTSWVSSLNVAASSCTGCGVCAERIPAATAVKITLLRRRIISSSERRLQRRQPHRLYQLNLHPPVFAILHQIFGRITQSILIPQLQADLGGDVQQRSAKLSTAKSLPPVCSESSRSTARTAHLLRRPSARRHGLVNADRVDLHVRFADGVAHLALRIAAGIVAAVRDYKDSLARVAGLLHMSSSPCTRRPAARC